MSIPKEKLISDFVTLVFKCRATNQSKVATLDKAKKFVRQNGKKWTDKLTILFESSWTKKIPKDLLEEFKPRIKPNIIVETKPAKEPRIKPNAPKVKEPKIKPKRQYVLERHSEPSDIDDPIYNKPLDTIKPTKRVCSNCGETFIQSSEYPNRLLCPVCNKWAQDIFSVNNIYASENSLHSSGIRKPGKPLLSAKASILKEKHL